MIRLRIDSQLFEQLALLLKAIQRNFKEKTTLGDVLTVEQGKQVLANEFVEGECSHGMLGWIVVE